MSDRYWTAGNVVALVCFVSVALLPWVYLLQRWPEMTVVDAAGALVYWVIAGTFAAANATHWRKAR